LKYWTRISAQPARPFLPFYHLKTSGFWHLHTKREQEKALAAITQFRTMPQLAQVVAYANFDGDLFALLLKPETREIIRQAIIESYFADQKILMQSIIDENRKVSNLERLLLEQAEHPTPKINAELASETPQRSAAFRGVIIQLYDYTCAACHLRIIALNGASAVDAAHIVPFAVSHDDGIGNGLALCKLHHWAFDVGLISLNEQYQLPVSNAFEESGPKDLLLKSLQGKKILLPSKKPFFPTLSALDWHRKTKFQN
jgi:putative restriction endonuclease